MPYIPQNERHKLDGTINQLITLIRDMTGSTDLSAADGRLNYTITRLLIGVLSLAGDPKYHKFNAAVGVLECAKLELYRRLAAEYENKKIIENGDVI